MQFTNNQKQLIIELVRDRYMAVVDMAANEARESGDSYRHDAYVSEYMDLAQILKELGED